MNSYISHDDIIVIDLLDEVDDVIVSVGNCQGLTQMHEGAKEQFVRVRHNAWNNDRSIINLIAPKYLKYIITHAD